MKAPLSYRALARVSSPLPVAFTVYTALKARSVRYLKQRFGAGFPARNDKPVWFHCASVGEVQAAAPLIRKWREHGPEQAIVISNVTPTGAQTALRQLPADITHCYLPIDWPGAVERFLKATAPCCAVILETEIWPSLYAACASRDIPIAVVNGRLSQRTMQTSAWLRNVYAQTLKHPHAILTRSDSDGEKFITLGAPAQVVTTVGNIKFAAGNDVDGEDSERPDLIRRRYWLAASTHDNEELQLALLNRKLERTDVLLVIAPRHPQRKSAILRQLSALPVNVAVRSQGDEISRSTDIYLTDTLGEMASLMQHADCVFMGGSLVPVGGHNVLEPARLGKAIVSGPHTQNITDEVESLNAAGGLLVVADETQLLATVRALLDDSGYRESIGKCARRFMNTHADVAAVYLQHLKDMLKTGSRDNL